MSIPLLAGQRQGSLKLKIDTDGNAVITRNNGFSDTFVREQAGEYKFTISNPINPDRAAVQVTVEGSSTAFFVGNYAINDLGDIFRVRVFDKDGTLSESFLEFSLEVTELY